MYGTGTAFDSELVLNPTGNPNEWGGDMPDGGRCIVLEGADLTTVWPLFEAGNALTPFTSDGADHQLMIRPLIPGEASPCP